MKNCARTSAQRDRDPRDFEIPNPDQRSEQEISGFGILNHFGIPFILAQIVFL
jgi:hypothetical protein